MIVGLRQTRAAQRTAEVASQAAHDEWRGNTRREAAITFVLAGEQQLETIRVLKIAEKTFDLDEVAQMWRELLNALALVRIEGPEPFSAKASQAWKTLNSVTLDVVSAHRRLTPVLLLRSAAAQGDQAAKMVLKEINRPRENPVPAAVWAALRESQLFSPKENLSAGSAC